MHPLRILCFVVLHSAVLGCNLNSSQPPDSAAPSVKQSASNGPVTAGLSAGARALRAFGVLRSWFEPASPFRIVGPIYFVGTRGLGAYLIATPNGHIMLDGGMPSSARDIEASIRRLGFEPRDIKIILVTHAHIDHAGTVAHFRKLAPAAAVAVMEGDAEILQTGGREDPVYGGFLSLRYPATTPTRVLKDGSTVSLGDITLTARKGAGHSPGCTTWITTVTDDGRPYVVVFPGSSNVNPGMRLLVEPSWPGIADDFRATFQMLESMKPDVWLGAHTERFSFESKRTRMENEGVSAWVDPQGFREYVAADKARFERLLEKENKRD